MLLIWLELSAVALGVRPFSWRGLGMRATFGEEALRNCHSGESVCVLYLVWAERALNWTASLGRRQAPALHQYLQSSVH